MNDTLTDADAEPWFGSPGCTCRAWTRQEDPPRYLKPGESIEKISGWERGADCPHHRVRLEITDEERDAMLRRIVTVTAEIRKIAEAVAPAVVAAVKELEKAFAALKDAGLLDDDGKPIAPKDRPAWASPYGPPPHRRHR
ncbi:hypothetical protein PYK79_50095 [Streptomyces sp. ID05-04B]|uniref:hypothetical protein n=1 Tax=Streptomyces sp. ID05-04B TaxID=3028661 RepID=UPI0029C2AA56|nr:hypothetical protein [Streptomyces sp. ID05-04B]MDX5569833.1 hypothetical protein [Streptomyces sp. ID05-04B]